MLQVILVSDYGNRMARMAENTAVGLSSRLCGSQSSSTRLTGVLNSIPNPAERAQHDRRDGILHEVF
jgi:hypothetical protein